MSNTSESACFAPFLDASKFSTDQGYIRGRLCASLGDSAGQLQCCLPCPATDWVYPDNFYNLTKISGFIAIISVILCIYLLLSWAVLPPDKTRRQYTNVCITASVLLFEMGSVLPILAKPPRCYDDITPNDNVSSMSCAWSGAFLVAGAVAMSTWTAVRALSMHLLICWNVTLSATTNIAMHVLAWGASIILLGVCIGITGVSSRFGDYCLVNQYKSLETFWGPMLGIAAITTSIQLATFAYCLHVFIKNLRASKLEKMRSSLSSNIHHQTARMVYERVKKVVQLQWLALALVTIMLSYTIFFSVVFVVLDSVSTKHLQDESRLLPWIQCLYETKGDKSACLRHADRFVVKESVILAILVMLAIVGIQAWLLFARRKMFTGWLNIFKKLLRRDRSDDDAFEIGQMGELRPPPASVVDKHAFDVIRVEEATARGSNSPAVETSAKRESVLSLRVMPEDRSPTTDTKGYHHDHSDVEKGKDMGEGNIEMEIDPETDDGEGSTGMARSSYETLSHLPPVRSSFASSVVDRGWRL